MKKILAILMILVVQQSFAQREANVWHFGAGVGLDFNSCEPQPAYSEIRSSEGCTSIADGAGQLQFYTEGSTIWNRNHEIMLNGDGLLGHRSATQAAMIIKRPGNSNEYYVFTVDEIGKTNGLMYSFVDMNGDGGLGAVISKNNPLVTPIVEKLHAVRHANGSDVWVSVHGLDNNNFYSFLVTASGVDPVPVTSAVGPVISGTELATIGAMKFSPNGSKLAICNYEHGVGLLDFDTNTGLFSNPITVTPRLYSYGVEFSQSSNLLYMSTSYLDIDNKLLQYDLRAPIIEESEVVLLDLSDRGGIGSLQLGPDQKLYVSIVGRDYLSVINKPDGPGLTCNFVENGLELFGGEAKAGLPLFLSPIFHDEMIVEDTCFGDLTNFRISKNVDAITWDFGDPDSGVNNTSTEIEPLHVFSAPGTYTVTTNIPANCGPTPTITMEVEVSGTQASYSVQLVQCDDDSDGFSFFNLNEADEKLAPDTETKFWYYRTKEDAERRENGIIQPNQYENITPYSDSVWVSIPNSTGCYQVIEVELVVSANAVFDSSPPLVFDLCDDAIDDGITTFDLSSSESAIAELFPGQAIDISYFRNLEHALAETNVISEISSYENIGYPFTQDIYVRVDDRSTNDCLGIGSPIQLIVKQQPRFDVITEIDLCLADTPTVTLSAFNAEDSYSYEWTDINGQVISTEMEVTIDAGGPYALTATSGNGCSSFPIIVDVIEYSPIDLSLDMISITDGRNSTNTILIDETKIGIGEYQYALDDESGAYQESPFFDNVATGVHTLFVREKNSCSPGSLEISVIGFPKFFTPNNDAKNDTWNLLGLSEGYSLNSKVSIFDRYGNLIKQISPSSIGWDGTLDGRKSIQSDYWFRAELVDQHGDKRILSGHFSLIR